MRILIIKFRHIGDVLLTTPLIANLHHHYPNALIDIAINKESEGILKNNPHINQILSYDRAKIKSSSLLKKVKEEVKYLKGILNQKYDLVLNLTEGDRGAIISRLLNSKKRIGIRSRNRFIDLLQPYTNSIDRLPYRHTVERELSFLEILNLKVISKRVELYSNAPMPQELDKYNYIVIHPVSRWMSKSWKKDSFAKLIDIIQSEYNLSVVLTGGSSSKEKEYNSSIENLSKTKPINLTGEISLEELTTLLRNAKGFIGLDTAPMHMAAACDIPVIALFGPSDPILWGPWENELQMACYTKKRQTQSCGKHTVIIKGDDKIIWENGHKVSTAMMRIEPKDILDSFEKKIA